MIVTQTYCDQNIAKASIVYTINNWHASCTRNFKNPLASTYSSLNTENWFSSQSIFQIPEEWFDVNPTSLVSQKIPEQVTNYEPYWISRNKKFWSRKANNEKVTFHNTHCPFKSWNTRTSNFWTICI